jgi:hypothetical protein
MVRLKGFEPSRDYLPLRPQRSASANSAIAAQRDVIGNGLSSDGQAERESVKGRTQNRASSRFQSLYKGVQASHPWDPFHPNACSSAPAFDGKTLLIQGGSCLKIRQASGDREESRF